MGRGEGGKRISAGVRFDENGNMVRYSNGAVAIRRRRGRQVGRKGRTGDTATAFERARNERYKDTIRKSREDASEFAKRAQNAKPITERPKGVKMQDWLTQNPDLDKALRLLKRETTTLRKRTGKRSEQSVLHMPAPLKYDRNSQRLTYKSSDREAVMETIRAIEKEMKVDLSFALSRIDWID